MPWNETSGNNFAALAGSLGSNASSLTQGIQQGASGLAGAILDQGQRNFDNKLPANPPNTELYVSFQAIVILS